MAKNLREQYKNTINNEYVNIYDICDRVTENTFDEFQERYSNNLPKNANIIFGVALHMLNHHFLTLAEKYYGHWNYQSFETCRHDIPRRCSDAQKTDRSQKDWSYRYP